MTAATTQSHWSFLGLGWYRNSISGTGGYSDHNQGKECDNGHGNDSSGCSTKGGLTAAIVRRICQWRIDLRFRLGRRKLDGRRR